MGFRMDPKVLADAMEQAVGLGECQVVLIREITDVELVHSHLWSGWSWWRVWDWAFEPVYEILDGDDYDDYPYDKSHRVVGQKLAHKPLNELLRPTKRVTRWEEVGLSEKTTGRRKGPGTIVFDEVSFGGKGKEPLPTGVYIGCRLKDASGLELGVMKFQSPIKLIAGEVLHTTSMGLEIS